MALGARCPAPKPRSASHRCLDSHQPDALQHLRLQVLHDRPPAGNEDQVADCMTAASSAGAALLAHPGHSDRAGLPSHGGKPGHTSDGLWLETELPVCCCRRTSRRRCRASCATQTCACATRRRRRTKTLPRSWPTRPASQTSCTGMLPDSCAAWGLAENPLCMRSATGRLQSNALQESRCRATDNGRDPMPAALRL